ncbi:class I SAM-dependent methyltransferase [Candidatus Dependentiae bacterium]|nr:class I SAM-dependent methyltransferase [Candidatus Dependentiae bacterium]
MSFYNKLCTEFYDLETPWASEQEVLFYSSFLEQYPGIWLEAMSGSGRLLLPLLKHGYNIQGVDNSEHMIQSCLKRATNQYGTPVIFNQSLTDLTLERKYAGVCITYSSFQLIYDRDQAFKALEQLNKCLLPGGILILECFIPWDIIKDTICGQTPLKTAGPYTTKRVLQSINGTLLYLKSSITLDTQAQRMTSKGIFERRTLAGTLLEQEQEEHIITWYYQYEMELLLEKAGFKLIALYQNSHHLEPQDSVFTAVKY